MTYQGDPNRDLNDPNQEANRAHRQRRRDFLRKEDGSWSAIPLLLGAVALVFGIYLLFGPAGDQVTPRQTGIERPNPTNAPGTSISPTPAPAPTPPKN
jgi:hypothetical protein